MELTHKQEEGLKVAINRYRNGEPYTVIAGYAGAGKSTLIKFIIDALGFFPEEVAYVAYTGKAAQVLRSKGCPDAMTTHRLLYKSIQRPDGTYIHIPRDSIADYRVIVVDEVSMLPQEMWDLLLSHGIYVIACGDPGQLPPISGSTTVLDHPHIFLDEIMRQAEDSEIIRLSANVRNGVPLKPYHGTEINIIKPEDYFDGMLTWADQVICGKNVTRNHLNAVYRKMLWGKDCGMAPLIGDKVICLKNNWDKINGPGDALVNGTIGKITGIKTMPNLWLGTKANIDFCPEEYPEGFDPRTGEVAEFQNILIDWKLITTHEPTLNKENFRTFPKILRPEQFDYGYVVTAHKSQGSEFDKVLVFEEMLKPSEHNKWLYTAVTRASKKLTLVMRS